jgi:hypothetical protein
MQDPAPPHFSRVRATILFVEDNVQIHSLLRRSMEQAQLEVLCATSATEATLLAAGHPGPIHLLISDLRLPDGSGAEIAKQVKQLHPRAEVMFISGYGSGEVRAQGIDPALIFLLPKPFSVSDFQTQVETILAPVLAR